MGGRGSSSGIYGKNNEKLYGSEYHMITQIENIKIIVPNQGAISSPLETMTTDRIYAIVDDKNKIGYISFYDEKGKKYKQIDIDRHPHVEKGIQLGYRHVHLGYEHSEKGSRTLSKDECLLVEEVLKTWENYKHVQ